VIRILIVDDEPIARGGIRTLLGTQPDMEVVGECASGEEAIQAIRSARPDVVFLDIQMPDGDGFQVLESLHEEDGAPRIVFVTAYDDYAVRAFEVNAVDYLLKPFDRRRFLSTLDRIRTALEVGADPAGARERLRDLLEEFGLRRDAGSSRSYRDGRVIVRDLDGSGSSARETSTGSRCGETTSACTSGIGATWCGIRSRLLRSGWTRGDS